MEEITLCPICDQPIKGHWCSNCKHIIQEPVRRKVRESADSLAEQEQLPVVQTIPDPEMSVDEAVRERDDHCHNRQEPVRQEWQESADPLEAREQIVGEQKAQEPPEPEMPGDEADKDNQSETVEPKPNVESKSIEEKDTVNIGAIVAVIAAVIVVINFFSSTIAENSDPMSGYPFDEGNSIWYDGMLVTPGIEP